MLEFLNNIDVGLFVFLNKINSPLWDQIMWWISGKKEWVPLYLFLIGLIIYKYRWKAILAIFCMAILITLSDQISVHWFKNVFQRFRPSHNPDLKDIIHLVNNKHGGRFGFVSSHAANTFAAATYISLLFKKKYFSWVLFSWATVVSYSRIYLGLHYPGDILFGALLGYILGIAIFRCFNFIMRKWDEYKLKNA